MTDFTRQQKINDFVRQNQSAYTTTLTISLLVSNSIKTIRNCMESLQPLLAQVPSELIIVDTVGPENSDGSLAIAEKYADKVVHFKWCDDFAAARNAGLKEAHGKWFMFLDDDEWFDDVEELVAFFNDDNEQQKYFSLAYNIHNYYDATGTSYRLTKYNRCSRLWKNSEFVGKVHEVLNPTFSPTKYVANTFVHHYGYAKEVGDAKTNRNSKLLKQLVADNPADMHAWSQLVAGYNRSTAKNRQKVIYFAELALNNFEKIPAKNDNEQIFAAAVLGYWLEAVSLEKDWHQVIKLAKKYLPTMYLQSYNLCMIDYFIFSAFIQLNNKNNAVVIFKEYLANFNIVQNNEQLLLRQYTPFLPYTVSYTKLAEMSSIVLSFLIENKSWKKVTSLIRQLPISSNVKDFSKVILNICKASFTSQDSTILQVLWNQLPADDKQLLELAKLINS
ncbi:glycosyltransferase, partial [Liquorilactobacillus ghanensis]|uniref:glycosyltransferase n=1 Tax=Liquorilactobacillus ghanensis TaxID=399370 RepID=UPI0039E73DC6